MGQVISGEYNFVAWVSRDQAALARAHSTPCTQHEARELIAALAPGLGVRVLFNGRKGMSTRSRDDKMRRISLPGQPGSGVGKLRVGIVLHELAHQMAPLHANHSTKFVDILDDLVAAWSEREAQLYV